MNLDAISTVESIYPTIQQLCTYYLPVCPSGYLFMRIQSIVDLQIKKEVHRGSKEIITTITACIRIM